MNVFITGAAGFIGFHLTQKLTRLGYHVVGIDNLNDYYDVNLKKSRLEILRKQSGFEFVQADLTDKKQIDEHERDHSDGHASAPRLCRDRCPQLV